MQIEEGKYYRTRGGEKAGPMKRFGSGQYPWEGVVGSACKSWGNDGRYVNNTDEINSDDIISEWVEEPAKVGTTPETFSRFWTVHKVDASNECLSRHWRRYLAEREAQHLAKNWQGTVFVVLEAVAAFRAEEPPITALVPAAVNEEPA